MELISRSRDRSESMTCFTNQFVELYFIFFKVIELTVTGRYHWMALDIGYMPKPVGLTKVA